MSTLEQLRAERELWTRAGFAEKSPPTAAHITIEHAGVWYYADTGAVIVRLADGTAHAMWQHDHFIGTIDEAEAWLAAQIDAEFPPGEVA